MFIDEVSIEVRGGSGGEGKISFASWKIGGGPDGGNGGDGGNLFVRGTTDLTVLSYFTSKPVIKAESGVPGGKSKMSGRRGEDLTIIVPIGSTITDLETQETFEVESLEPFLLCAGGFGGTGNFDLRSPTNTTPRETIPATPPQIRNVKIVLKLIADFGLIGLPNAGKSTLLNLLTGAHAKVGNYKFTTLEPNLGVLNKKIIADIPGLIAGASSGKGLGVKFLKHIEKVHLLVHCISLESNDPTRDYHTVWNEMKIFNESLTQKQEIIVLTKSDMVDLDTLKKRVGEMKKLKKKVIALSIHDEKTIKRLKDLLI